MTKFTLFSALSAKGDSWVKLPDGRRMLLCSVGRESGNGSCFNVGGYVDGLYETVYIRTVD